MADRTPGPAATTAEIIHAKWSNSQEWFSEAFGQESTPKTPPNPVLRRAVAAIGIAAVLALVAWVLIPTGASSTGGTASDRSACR